MRHMLNSLKVSRFAPLSPPRARVYPSDVRIYTKKGDDGTTGLLYGGRVSKGDLATDPDQRHKLKPGISLVTPDMTDDLERLIDRSVEEHPLPEEFIVPGAN